jgi:hypothetical protein
LPEGFVQVATFACIRSVFRQLEHSFVNSDPSLLVKLFSLRRVLLMHRQLVKRLPVEGHREIRSTKNILGIASMLVGDEVKIRDAGHIVCESIRATSAASRHRIE